jgi:DNA polymerase III epsilon subunit family exonuclease
MLGNKRGRQLTKYVPDYVVFDLETTGISPRKDAVIEISAVKVRQGTVVGEFNELVNPGRPIPYGASQINNIFDEMVKDAPFFDEVLGRFIDFIGDDVLVGHNIHKFDMSFICRDAEKYFGRTIGNDYIDTLQMAKECFPDWQHRRLGDLAAHYGISTSGAHRALADCMMNQQVYERMHRDMGNPARGQSDQKRCPRCGSVMQRRNGRFGEFWGCSGYPVCKYTENIS